MAFTYTAGASDRDMVRLIVGDVRPDSPLFQDEEINAFLGLENQDVRYAAAMALDRIASSQAMLLQSIELLDIKADAMQLAQVLRDHATALRCESDTEPAFDIAEQAFTPDGYAHLIWNARFRSAV